MADTSHSLIQAVSVALKETVIEHSLVVGGDINHAYKVKTNSGLYFVKYNTAHFAEAMFKAEANGLNLIADAKVIKTAPVKKVFSFDQGAGLILEFLPTGILSQGFWNTFGLQLAQLHQSSHNSYGLDFDNFIGTLPQSNQSHLNWVNFYIQERIKPQLSIGISNGLFNLEDEHAFDILFDKFSSILPEEPPALVHGDLWSGNYLVGRNDTPILIDPAPYFGHREMDLAMMRLFGGFPEVLFKAYHFHFPIISGFSERVDLYKLYYLMVHVNLFGAAYLTPVRNILRRFV